MSQPTKAFKILTADQWEAWNADGTFKGLPIDLKDGFIHLSTDKQVVETYQNHFQNTSGVVLVMVDLEKISAEVKWEVGRGGQQFPHVYGTLEKSAVVKHVPGWTGEAPEV